MKATAVLYLAAAAVFCTGCASHINSPAVARALEAKRAAFSDPLLARAYHAQPTMRAITEHDATGLVFSPAVSPVKANNQATVLRCHTARVLSKVRKVLRVRRMICPPCSHPLRF